MRSRNYGVDLLRILSMYMIVILHILGAGGVLNNLEVLSLKYNLVWLLEIICYCAVNCYALITGYVMVNSKFKYRKIFGLWGNVLFWSLSLTILISFFYPELVGKKDFLKSVLNVSYDMYWYFSSYFALFFFIPFINKFISILNKADYKRLIVTIVVLMSTINLIRDSFSLNNGYSLIWLVFLYFIGAYIKKFDISKKVNKSYILFGIVISILLTLSVKLIFIKYSNEIFNFIGNDILVKYNSFTILFVAVGLLLIFSDLRINNKYVKRFIMRLAPATFGVYLIHEHFLVKKIFMINRFKFIITYDWYLIIMWVLFLAFIIYMICSYLEMIRLVLFKKLKLFVLGDISFNILKVILKKFKLYEEEVND